MPDHYQTKQSHTHI